MPDVYKVVNATQLDAALTYTADRLRIKLGDNDDILFDFENRKGFGDAVDDISAGGGITPTGTINISENGTYDVTDKASAVVNVSGDPYDMFHEINSNSLSSLSDSTITEIRAYMFFGNSAITQIDLPNITKIRTAAFQNSGLSGAVTIDRFINPLEIYAFRGCNSMTSITFKSGTHRIDSGVFEGCRNLVAIDIGNWGSNGIVNIAGDGFYNTQALQAMIIRGSTVFPLASAFASSCGLSATLASGYIYVPSDLVSSYQAATNWSIYSDRILPIEGSIYETQYADGTPIPTE